MLLSSFLWWTSLHHAVQDHLVTVHEMKALASISIMRTVILLTISRAYKTCIWHLLDIMTWLLFEFSCGSNVFIKTWYKTEVHRQISGQMSAILNMLTSWTTMRDTGELSQVPTLDHQCVQFCDVSILYQSHPSCMWHFVALPDHRTFTEQNTI